jgi:hypothetical protein
VRATLHEAVWQAIQAECNRLAQLDEVLWAGATETKPKPRWLAFAGADEHAPLNPEDDQVLSQVRGRCPPWHALLTVEPPRPRRDYFLGLLVPAGITLVVVPDRTCPKLEEALCGAITDPLRALEKVLPVGTLGTPSKLTLAASFQPPPSSSPPTPAHAWAWVPVPTVIGKKRTGR